MKQQKSFEKGNRGCLYLVPTPIGNLDDMTFRAVNTLKEVHLIAAEDTRHTQKLLNHFHIDTPQISYHEHNAKERLAFLLDKLLGGENVAQVSDAGMPSISDPGHDLVKACVAHDIPVIALPGANAAITALVASGLSPQPFCFYGFLPRKKSEQEKELTRLKGKEETLIFYESPFRIKATLINMGNVFHVNRQVVVCRELTKRYEEYTRGTIEELIQWFSDNEVKGEICLLVSGVIDEELDQLTTLNNHGCTMPSHLSAVEQVDWLIQQHNVKANEAIKKVAKQLNKTKQEIYKLYHKEK